MARSHKNSPAPGSGRGADQSAKPVGKTQGSPVDKSVASDSDDWGYQPGKGGMAIEAKLGMFIIMILVGAFGFLVYRRVDMHENRRDGSEPGNSVVETDAESKSLGEPVNNPMDVAIEFGMENEVTAAVVDSNDTAAFTAGAFDEHEHEIADATESSSHTINFADDDDPFADDGFANVDNAQSPNSSEVAFADSAFDDVSSEPSTSAFDDSLSMDVASSAAPTLSFDEDPVIDDFANDPLENARSQPSPEIADAVSDDPFAMEANIADSQAHSDSGSTAFDLYPEPSQDDVPRPVLSNDEFDIASAPMEQQLDRQVESDAGWQSVNAPAADVDSSVELSLDASEGESSDEHPLSLFDPLDEEMADSEPESVVGSDSAFGQELAEFDEPVIRHSEPDLPFDNNDEMEVAQLDDGRRTDSAGLFDASPFENDSSSSSSAQERNSIDEFAPFDDVDLAEPSVDDNDFEHQALNIEPRPVADVSDQEPLLDLLPIDAESTLQAPIESRTPASPSIEIREKRRFNASDYVYENRVVPASAETEPCEICKVLQGDNYWKISRRAYGTSRYFSALALYNSDRIPNPKRLRAGMKVLLPDAEVLERKYPQLFRDSNRKPKAPTGFFVQADGTAAYRIGERDTLSEIAQKHLGRSSRWIQIYRLNRGVLANPNRLKPGTVIALPDDATDVHMVP